MWEVSGTNYAKKYIIWSHVIHSLGYSMNDFFFLFFFFGWECHEWLDIAVTYFIPSTLHVVLLAIQGLKAITYYNVIPWLLLQAWMHNTWAIYYKHQSVSKLSFGTYLKKLKLWLSQKKKKTKTVTRVFISRSRWCIKSLNV